MKRKTAADFMEWAANAKLADARKKVPMLKWGTHYILSHDKGRGCIQGIAALASCASPQALAGLWKIPDVVFRRFGLLGASALCPSSRCPACGDHPNNVADAVAHVNDEHFERGFAAVKGILRRWIKQERAGAGG